MPKQVIIPRHCYADCPFVPGTLADGVVYVSGTLPFDKQNNVIYPGDPKAQTRHVLEIIKSVIETAGQYGGCDLQQYLYHRLAKLRRD